MAEERGDGWTPPQLAEKPELHSFCAEIWSAFVLLSPSRAMTSSGAAAISLQEIESFFRLYKISEDDQEDFIFLLRILDVEYIKLVRDRLEQEAKKAK